MGLRSTLELKFGYQGASEVEVSPLRAIRVMELTAHRSVQRE